MPKIKIAIAGVGNCASSLVQGVHHYAHGGPTVGLMHDALGPWRAGDIEVVAAFDVDARKVGRPVEEAIFAPPNNTKIFARPTPRDGSPRVLMGPVLDGVPAHMADYPSNQRFELSGAAPVDVAGALRDSGAEILVNY